MERVRINFHDHGVGTRIFNNLMQAYYNENGVTAEFYSGYYERKTTWQSQLTEWISKQGYPCQAWCQRTKANGEQILEKYLPVGIEVESPSSTYFLVKWS